MADKQDKETETFSGEDSNTLDSVIRKMIIDPADEEITIKQDRNGFKKLEDSDMKSVLDNMKIYTPDDGIDLSKISITPLGNNDGVEKIDYDSAINTLSKDTALNGDMSISGVNNLNYNHISQKEATGNGNIDESIEYHPTDNYVANNLNEEVDNESENNNTNLSVNLDKTVGEDSSYIPDPLHSIEEHNVKNDTSGVGIDRSSDYLYSGNVESEVGNNVSPSLHSNKDDISSDISDGNSYIIEKTHVFSPDHDVKNSITDDKPQNNQIENSYGNLTHNNDVNFKNKSVTNINIHEEFGPDSDTSNQGTEEDDDSSGSLYDRISKGKVVQEPDTDVVKNVHFNDIFDGKKINDTNNDPDDDSMNENYNQSIHLNQLKNFNGGLDVKVSTEVTKSADIATAKDSKEDIKPILLNELISSKDVPSSIKPPKTGTEVNAKKISTKKNNADLSKMKKYFMSTVVPGNVKRNIFLGASVFYICTILLLMHSFYPNMTAFFINIDTVNFIKDVFTYNNLFEQVSAYGMFSQDRLFFIVALLLVLLGVVIQLCKSRAVSFFVFTVFLLLVIYNINAVYKLVINGHLYVLAATLLICTVFLFGLLKSTFEYRFLWNNFVKNGYHYNEEEGISKQEFWDKYTPKSAKAVDNLLILFSLIVGFIYFMDASSTDLYYICGIISLINFLLLLYTLNLLFAFSSLLVYAGMVGLTGYLYVFEHINPGFDLLISLFISILLSVLQVMSLFRFKKSWDNYGEYVA